ncbi:hypothetical protein B0A55_07885 [Friedmanniomyces simplex]|uniref:Uncharacterized protein n=1 Tax=Friedmanniomyces simplex TaxID=329884 RepID=A0A4U0XCA8_9PEZI|nr:hypothetical protein B0A55_07885 [Friedmanniomyces simplex]
MLRRQTKTAALAEQHPIDPADTELRLEPVCEGWLLVNDGHSDGNSVKTPCAFEDTDVACAAQSQSQKATVVDAPAAALERRARDREQCAQRCAQLSATLQKMITTLGDHKIDDPAAFDYLLSDFHSKALLVTESSLAIKQTASLPQEDAYLGPGIYDPQMLDGHCVATDLSASEPSGMMPTVMTMYIIRAGDASIARERIAEFDQEVALRCAREGEATGPSMGNLRLTDAERLTRSSLTEELQCAVQDAAVWKAQCVHHGLDPDAARFRRRSSTSKHPTLPPRVLAKRVKG